MTSPSLPREMLTGPERDVSPIIIMGVQIFLIRRGQRLSKYPQRKYGSLHRHNIPGDVCRVGRVACQIVGSEDSLHRGRDIIGRGIHSSRQRPKGIEQSSVGGNGERGLHDDRTARYKLFDV